MDDRTLILNPSNILAAHAMLMSGDGGILAQSVPTGERLANSRLCPSGFSELAAMALRLEHREIPDDRIEMLRTAFSTTSLPVARGLSIEKTALQFFLDQSSNWRSVARTILAQSSREGAVVRLATEKAFEKVGRDGELKTTSITEESPT